MTLEELRALRNQSKSALHNRDNSEKNITVIIGMGTCGIASGAKEVLDQFVTELNSKGITNVTVKQTGCMGLCHVEPTVEVKAPEMPDTIYGKVSSDLVKEIVEKHIVEKQLVAEHIYDKPAADILS